MTAQRLAKCAVDVARNHVVPNGEADLAALDPAHERADVA